MIAVLKKLFAVAGLGALIAGVSLVYAGSFSDSTVGGGGNAQGHKTGSVTIPAGALCQYFGNTISDGYNPPGTATIWGPLGYDYINYNGHSPASDTNWNAVSPGTYNYSLDAYGMCYCGFAVRW